MRLLLARSLAHPRLADAELEAVCRAHDIGLRREAERGRLAIVHLDADRAIIASLLDRLAMTNEAALSLFLTDAGPAHLKAAARAFPLAGPGSFAVRAERVGPDRAPETMTRTEVERAVGAAYAEAHPVDLDAPDRIVRVWLDHDDAIAGELMWQRDKVAYEARAPKNRPFFSPVSGDPRWMRAIVNLAGVAPGGTVYDPLCGTGAVVLEAALCGLRSYGSDIDPAMVEGTARNLTHFDAEATGLFVSDVREAASALTAQGVDTVDAVVTDLPYGQSASTQRTDPADVARWTLETAASVVKADGRIVVGTADPTWLASPPPGWQVADRFPLRVHKSLTRTYFVFARG